MTSCIVYKIECTESPKIYIGKTIRSLHQRFYHHCWDAKNKKGNTVLGHAIRKYGQDCFNISPILICEDTEADYYEIEIIKKYETLSPSGYNARLGGSGVYDYVGESVRGEDHGGSKLTEDDAYYVIACGDKTVKELSIEFNVDRHAISNIKYGKSWKHLDRSSLKPFKKSPRKGLDHHNGKVSQEDVDYVLSQIYVNAVQLADELDVSQSVILNIRHGLHSGSEGLSEDDLRKSTLFGRHNITEEDAQYVLDNPHVSTIKLKEKLGAGIATIRRIKARETFLHLTSNATEEQWSIFKMRQDNTVSAASKRRKSKTIKLQSLGG